jgi:hypothetical protein
MAVPAADDTMLAAGSEGPQPSEGCSNVSAASVCASRASSSSQLCNFDLLRVATLRSDDEEDDEELALL